jgi:hypothetical protein
MTGPEEQERPSGGRMFCVACKRTVYNPSNQTPRQMPAQFGPPDSSCFIRCIPCYRVRTGVPYSDYYWEHRGGDLNPASEA